MSAMRQDAMPAAEMMATLASELDRMRALGLRIEGSLCALAGEVSSQGAWMEDLQQFDMLLQQLAALRDFLGKVALASDAEARIDVSAALAHVTLHDLRQRLSGVAGEVRSDADIFFDPVDVS